MGFLKGLGLAFLSILLFLSVLLLGVGITVNTTALNPGFINDQIERLDIAGIINEEISTDPSANDLPQTVRAFLNTELPAYSEQIKSAVKQANDRLYDYVLGRVDTLDLNSAIGDTVLDPELIYPLADKVDWPAVADELVRKEIAKNGGVDPTFAYLLDYIDDAAVKLDPWIKSTLREIVPPIHDYLLGQTQTLNVSISLEQPAVVLYSTFLDAFNRSPPPQLSGSSAAQKQAAFNNFFFVEVIPSLPAVIDIDPSFFGGAPQEINQGLADLRTGLGDVRTFVASYWLAFYGLIVLIVLLFGLSWLILRRVEKLLLFSGIILFILGSIGFVSVIVADSIISGIDFGSVPVAIQTWLPGTVQSVLRPFLFFNIAGGIIGVVAIVSSILIRRDVPPPKQTPILQ
ncbi:hypothetical protein [Dehalogenimonas etheniformans]|uniref:Uncharacterized protein n=1 Tax=Dehalogenimonas etheniformans TaxID=1536648 RepID=A0A2P5P7G4_9CHLR|nr:hypothetical protein [Dehalogenimonas etheniformans]PPD58236.1 hypothetical protein JP09_005450 [Dehalogenimonas etheniformans]QNT75645.1 hypothetical protein HX448_02550 [Dehalogenimonas etheniformans]